MCFSSIYVVIEEKRLGLNLHHRAVNSMDALQLKGSSADRDFEKVGQKNDWGPKEPCIRRPNQVSNRFLDSPDSHLHIDPTDLMT